RRDQADDRERMYIDALAAYHSEKNGKRKRQRYVRALENIIHAYPDDLEAKAFLAVQIWHNSVEGASITSYEAVDALIQQVLAQSPLHPIHHYRFHLCNYHKDVRALDSAAACGFAAPGIAHMWHMPGYIYSRLH